MTVAEVPPNADLGTGSRTDAATVNDRATYDEPEQPAVGLPHVLVNGVFAVRDGQYTGARAGRVLRAR